MEQQDRDFARESQAGWLRAVTQFVPALRDLS